MKDCVDLEDDFATLAGSLIGPQADLLGSPPCLAFQRRRCRHSTGTSYRPHHCNYLRADYPNIQVLLYLLRLRVRGLQWANSIRHQPSHDAS